VLTWTKSLIIENVTCFPMAFPSQKKERNILRSFACDLLFSDAQLLAFDDESVFFSCDHSEIFQLSLVEKLA
jgi:hypothetical protein